MKTKSSNPSVLLDDDRKAIFINGKEVETWPKNYKVLKALIEADGRVLSREQLIAMSQKPGDELNPADTRSIDQIISRLRKLVGDRIKTKTCFGYKFV